jgi:hypothetical protein
VVVRAVGIEQMTELAIPFRCVPERDQWRGRWLRGIELNQARLDSRGAHAKKRSQEQPADPHREPSTGLLEAWAPVEHQLREAVDEATFNIWLAALHPHALIDGKWRLAYRGQHVGWIRARFGRVIEGCAGRPVEFVACEAKA